MKAQNFEDASDSDTRLAEEHSIAVRKLQQFEIHAENMYEEKTIIISEQEI